MHIGLFKKRKVLVIQARDCSSRKEGCLRKRIKCTLLIRGFLPSLNRRVGCLIPCQGIQGLEQGVMRTFSRWSCLDRCEEAGSFGPRGAGSTSEASRALLCSPLCPQTREPVSLRGPGRRGPPGKGRDPQCATLGTEMFRLLGDLACQRGKVGTAPDPPHPHLPFTKIPSRVS